MTAGLGHRWDVTADGTRYRDLNGNGRMDPYEDPRLPVDERVADLLGRLSLEEKAGLMLHTIVSIPADGDLRAPSLRSDRPHITDMVLRDNVSHFNVHNLPEPERAARWMNEAQILAEQTPHGIPLTFSTDPRHSFLENSGASFGAGHFSAWPEPLGFGALRDEEAVREFAEIARQEYVAIGLRMALHPTLDLATEPRWARQYSTFGQDADLAGRLAIAYVDGFEGQLGAQSVACMAKHFPGGGPQKDGEDSHFPYGREHVYPGGRFEEHLEPFRALLKRGVAAIMPAYGIPIGLVRRGEPIEEVGMGFNRQIVGGLLREELGYDGLVCTDWGLISSSFDGERELPARAWGLEDAPPVERVRAALDAGNDQLGGEHDPSYTIELVRTGAIAESRLDESVRRILRLKFTLGLFDDPFVDDREATRVVGSDAFREAGHRAQARAVTPIVDVGLLPLREGTRVYAPELPPESVRTAGLAPVEHPADADVVVLRLSAPFEPRDEYMLEASFRAGSLEFDPAVVAKVAELAASAPVILAVHMDRPAVLSPLMSSARAVVAEFGASAEALLDALTGRIPPEGRLPFQLPATAAAAYSAEPDVAGGMSDVLFDYGHGIELGVKQ